MKLLLSTDGVAPHRKFDAWRDASYERLIPSEARKVGDDIFEGKLEAADIGGVVMTRATFGALHTDVTPTNIRRHGKQHTLSATIRLTGRAASAQNDRAIVHPAGDIVIIDRSKPVTLDFFGPTQSLVIELERSRLENLLGPADHFSTLNIGSELGSTKLATAFFLELVNVHRRLPPDTAARMASIGTDLLVASIAERLARATPKRLQGTVVVQRAKAYVETNLGDPALDPPHLAAAMGVSLRHLQQLFQARGQNISDWIWRRRLEVAANRLADPRRLQLSVGTLSYGCGFASQAHFSRRFKDRYGLTPSEFRRVAFVRT